MEEIVNFIPNVARLLLTLGSWRWYVIRAYVPPNNVPAVHSIEHALEAYTKVMEAILLGDLNAKLREPRDARDEYLVTALADSGIVDMISQFIPRRRYIGVVSWLWQMR